MALLGQCAGASISCLGNAVEGSLIIWGQQAEDARDLGLSSKVSKEVRPIAVRKFASISSGRSSSTGISSSRSREADGVKKAARLRTRWTPEIGKSDQLATRIKSLLSANDSRVEVALRDWDEFLPSRAIVSVLNSFSSWEKGVQFFDWAKSRGQKCEITVYVYNALLKLLKNNRKWEISEQLLSEMLHKEILPDSYTFTFFVNCSKRCGRAADAVKWFHKLGEAGVEFDAVTFSAMIDMYASSGQLAEVMDLYKSMRSKNYVPDIVTFGVIANLHSKAGDYQAIKRLFLDMEDSGLKPNVILYNNLLVALSRAGRVTMAREVFDEMLQCGMEPTEVTLSILIQMYSTVGAVDRIYEIYQDMKHKRWKCDLRVYNTLLRSCVDGGNVEAAEEMLREMEGVGHVADNMTLGIMMNVYATKGMAVKARELLDKTSDPNAALYSILMRAFKQAKQFDSIPLVFDEMISRGCSPDERLNGMLLSCATSTDASEAQRLAIISCLKTTSSRLHELLTRLLERETESVEQISKDVREFLVDEVPMLSKKPMCNSLVDFCWSLGMKEAAHRILEAGTEAGLYRGIHTKLPTIWHINLRTLSTATAECAVEAWIQEVQKSVEQGEELPEELMVETGSGRNKEGSRLGHVILSKLKELKSPFEEGSKPGGFVVASGTLVRRWLESRNKLLLNLKV